MPLVVKDRVMETTSSTGTGTITLGGAVAGFQSFSVIGNGNTTYYAIVGGTEWEIGLGTYTSAGTTLSRTTVLESSNGGSLVNFSAGTKNVFVTYAAEKSVYKEANDYVYLPSNLEFTGTGNRITGDFSNAVFADRASFQSSVTNGTSRICVLPNGTATSTSFNFFNNSDPTNSGRAVVGIESTKCYVQASISGTGTYLPLTLETNGTEKFRIAADATGTYTFGGTAPRITGDFSNATTANRVMFQSSTTNGNTTIYAIPNGTAVISSFRASNNSNITDSSTIGIVATNSDVRLDANITGTGTYLPMTFYTGGSERMRINTSGAVIIGNGETSATPAAGVLEATDGSGTNIAGASLTIQGGRGTGTGAGGSLLFSTAPAGTTGSALNAAQTRMTIDSTGNITVSQAARGTITANAASLSFNMNAASNFSCTPTAGGTLTFTNITAGQSGYILLVNNSNYAITAAATTKVGASFLSTISTTGTYLISYFSNGTNVFCTTSGALA